MDGVLASINVSAGGVPKLARQRAAIRVSGVDGDRQANLQIHGGPTRAVSLYSLDLIHALQAEGHPIAPGTIGENLTISGVPWESMMPGVWVDVGAVSLELTGYADPCRSIAGSFLNRDMRRVFARLHPGWSRLYARVVKEGTVTVGDPVAVR
jgi:MOSC domain-containing protein YiiM